MIQYRKYSKELSVAFKAAKAAGRILMQQYGRTERKYKAHDDIITKADLLCEKTILNLLKKNFPDYSIYSEEAGKQYTVQQEFLWVVDPLDGTTNYSMQNPLFNVSIGLVRKNMPVLGVVFNPYTKELFHAVEGQGAFLNTKRLSTKTENKELSKAIITFCHSSNTQQHIERALQLYTAIRPIARHMRQLGSAALELCYAAASRTDVFYMTDMNPYDVVAGAVIAKEAGCSVTDFDGKPFVLESRDILAAGPGVYERMQTLLTQL